MALFSEMVETKIDDPRGSLTRLIKYMMESQKNKSSAVFSYLMTVDIRQQ